MRNSTRHVTTQEITNIRQKIKTKNHNNIENDKDDQPQELQGRQKSEQWDNPSIYLWSDPARQNISTGPLS